MIETQTPFLETRYLASFWDELDFLGNEFLRNPLRDWIIALFIILGAILVTRSAYWFTEKYVKRLTGKTKTKLDDVLLETFKKPMVLAGGLAGTWFGLKYLDFAHYSGVDLWINGFFSVLITLLGAWLACRIFEAILDEYVAPYFEGTETDLDDVLLPIVRRGVRTIVWVVAIIMALDNAGYDITTVLAGLGVAGLAFAMAAKDSLSNLFGGFTIFTDKPFGLKDRIKVGGFDGSVTEIGMRSTRLKSLDGRMVTIPNSKISDSAVENVSSEPSRKVTVKLGLTYDMDEAKMARAMEVLREIVEEHKEDVNDDFAIGFNEFGDFSLNLIFVYRITKGSDLLGT
ncbi:MAG: mechanosensitive ion channel family protein, partial [Opitutales bacterium]